MNKAHYKVFIEIVLILLLSLDSFGIDIPEGIQYKPTNDERNQQAVALIQQILEQRSTVRDDLAAGALIIGPGLWQHIQTTIPNTQYEIIPSDIHIPNSTTGETQVLKAATFKNCQPIKTIISLILKQPVSSPITIRKLSPPELQIHWALISWDIEEPIYIAEVEKMQLLFSFIVSQEQLYILFLDDMAQYRREP